MRREYALDADVLAHELSDVVVGAHKAAVLVETKPCAELNGEKCKVFDFRLEICDGEDGLFWQAFLSAHREYEDE